MTPLTPLTPAVQRFGLQVALCSVMLAFGGGIWLGHTLTADHINARMKKQADAAVQSAAAAASAAAAEKQRGDQATDSLSAALREQGSYSATLLERQAHAPLTVSVARCLPDAAGRSGLVAAADSGGGNRGAAGPGLRLPGAAGVGLRQDGAVEGAGSVAPVPGSGDGVTLSLGAVSLWNSSLAGADTPAGACSPDAATAAACAAAAAGIGLDDVWRNHALNAASCAADRQRFQALTDFLRGSKP